MVEISNTTKQNPHTSDADFVVIKNAILGKTYELSCAFIGEKRARDLNRTHRGKTYVPNVLSFPLDATSGEMFITPSRVKREAKHFDMSPAMYERFLFIHGCLHLAGLDHGPEMDKLEQKFTKRFLNN